MLNFPFEDEKDQDELVNWLIVKSQIAKEAYDNETRRRCLIRVLRIDPLNEIALEELIEDDPVSTYLSPDVNDLLFVKSILESHLDGEVKNGEELINKINKIKEKIIEKDRELVSSTYIE
jgi:hypothetical protein